MLDAVFQRLPLGLRRRLARSGARAGRLLPIAWRSVLWNGLSLSGKPSLGYLETHLVDHCNLNCRRCLHFSPLAAPRLADPDAFGREMRRLAELFGRIRTVRLMGGEPLLHPRVTEFFPPVRQAFPSCRLHLVTNGLLLGRMDESFWQACRASGVIIDLTVYPPVRGLLVEIRRRCAQAGVALQESNGDRFCVRMNYRGDSPPVATFSACRELFYCPLLKDGRLYGCAPAAYVGDLNARFGLGVPAAEGFSIFEPGVSGRKLIRLLNEPVAMCGFCTAKTAGAAWASGAPERDDWDVSATDAAGSDSAGKGPGT